MDLNDMNGGIKSTIRWVAGLMIVGAYLYLAYLSLQEDFTLHPSVSITVFLFAMGLLFGPKVVVTMIETWRG